MQIDKTIRSANVLDFDKELWTVLFRPNHVPFLLLAFECRANDVGEATDLWKEAKFDASVAYIGPGDTEDAFLEYEEYLKESEKEEESYVYSPTPKEEGGE